MDWPGSRYGDHRIACGAVVSLPTRRYIAPEADKHSQIALRTKSYAAIAVSPISTASAPAYAARPTSHRTCGRPSRAPFVQGLAPLAES